MNDQKEADLSNVLTVFNNALSLINILLSLSLFSSSLLHKNQRVPLWQAEILLEITSSSHWYNPITRIFSLHCRGTGQQTTFFPSPRRYLLCIRHWQHINTKAVLKPLKHWKNATVLAFSINSLVPAMKPSKDLINVWKKRYRIFRHSTSNQFANLIGSTWSNVPRTRPKPPPSEQNWKRSGKKWKNHRLQKTSKQVQFTFIGNFLYTIMHQIEYPVLYFRVRPAFYEVRIYDAL